MPKRTASPSVPTRELPRRACKIEEYTAEQLGVEIKTRGTKRWFYAGFEPGIHQPINSDLLEVTGEDHKNVAALAAQKAQSRRPLP